MATDEGRRAARLGDSGLGDAARIREREDVLFAELVERQSRFVFRVAYAMLRNPEDAEDVVQDTFMKLYRNGAWRDMRDERGFLARTAWRVALDRLPTRRSLRPSTIHGPGDARKDSEASAASSVPHEELANALRSAAIDPEQAAAAAQWEAVVHRLIDALPEKLREPLALSSVDELNSREIAAVLGISEGTVRTRLMRARAMLKEKMAVLMEAHRGR